MNPTLFRVLFAILRLELFLSTPCYSPQIFRSSINVTSPIYENTHACSILPHNDQSVIRVTEIRIIALGKAVHAAEDGALLISSRFA